MATQNCPKCNSNRVRRGYRPTSILMKLFFRYNLLCDECNWEFSGFAVPGTVGTKTKKRSFKSSGNLQNDLHSSINQKNDLNNIKEDFSDILDNEILSAIELTEKASVDEFVSDKLTTNEAPQIVEKKKQTSKSKFKRKVRVKLH